MESINPYAAPVADAYRKPEPLRPRTFAEIVMAGTVLYTSRFSAVLAITAIVWIPGELIHSYIEYFMLDPEDVQGAFRLAMFMDALVGIIAVAGVTVLGAQEMRGEPVAWWSALGQGIIAWPRMFATQLVGGMVLGLAALCLVAPYFYFAPRFSLMETVTVLEGRAGPSAIRRSMDLTGHSYLLYLALCAITIIPVFVVGILVVVPMIVFPEIDHWLLSAALMWLSDLFTPWMTLVFVAAYFSALDQVSPAVGKQKPNFDFLSGDSFQKTAESAPSSEFGPSGR